MLSAALERRGIIVRTVFPAEPGPEDDALVAALGSPGGWAKLTRHWRALRRAVDAALENDGADLIHAHSWFPAALAAPPGIPLVLSAYNSDAVTLRHSRLARRLALPLFARATVVTAVSREVGDAIQSVTGRHVSRSHVQAMPINTTTWPWTVGGGGAIAVGNLVESARLDLAIHTVAVLASCGHAMPLTIIGEGPLRRELMRVADLNGVESLIRFAGTPTPDEILHCLSSADLMLHVARGDAAVPWVLAAVLTGLPVVGCWDGGGVAEFVPDNGPGRLALPSMEAISDAALGLLMDPDRLALAQLLGESRRARLAPNHVADTVAGWYREALGG